MKVLVVDEDRGQAALLKKLLLPDHEVETVHDGERAWARIADWNPDVLLLDWLLPKFGALELTKRIRGANNNSLYILMASAAITPSGVAPAFDVGIDDFVYKRATRDELLTRVLGAARKRKAMGLREGSGHDGVVGIINSLSGWKKVDAVICSDLATMLNVSLTARPWIEPPLGVQGATIRLSLPASRLELRFSVFADEASVGVLGEAMLGAKPSPDEAHDLLFEMVNAASGALKNELLAANLDLTMGLPGTIDIASVMKVVEGAQSVQRVTLGTDDASLYCIASIEQQANQLVPAEKLQEGMVVVRAICNDAGAMLIPAGTRITQSTAKRIAAALGEKLIEVSPLAA